MQNELEAARAALEEQAGVVGALQGRLAELAQDREGVNAVLKGVGVETAIEDVESAVTRREAIEALQTRLGAQLTRESRELEERQDRVTRIEQRLVKIREDLEAVDGAGWPKDIKALHRARLKAEGHALAGDPSGDAEAIEGAKAAIEAYDGSLTVTARGDLAMLQELVRGLEERSNE